MGTRHLISVISNGKTKVAQYGQWDGYLTATGAEIQSFLKYANLGMFKQRVDALTEWDDADIKQVWTDAGADGSGWVTFDVSDKVKAAHPELSRDTGSDVLLGILEGRVTKIVDQSDFANDTVFCEYHYVIDLDNYTVEVFEFGERILFDSIDDFCRYDMIELTADLVR